jgi:hypothetical protein
MGVGETYEDAELVHRWQNRDNVVGFMKFLFCIIDGRPMISSLRNGCSLK